MLLNTKHLKRYANFAKEQGFTRQFLDNVFKKDVGGPRADELRRRYTIVEIDGVFFVGETSKIRNK